MLSMRQRLVDAAAMAPRAITTTTSSSASNSNSNSNSNSISASISASISNSNSTVMWGYALLFASATTCIAMAYALLASKLLPPTGKVIYRHDMRYII